MLLIPLISWKHHFCIFSALYGKRETCYEWYFTRNRNGHTGGYWVVREMVKLWLCSNHCPFVTLVFEGSPLQFTGLDIETNSLDIVNAPRLHWMWVAAQLDMSVVVLILYEDFYENDIISIEILLIFASSLKVNNKWKSFCKVSNNLWATQSVQVLRAGEEQPVCKTIWSHDILIWWEKLHGKSIKSILFQYLGRPVVVLVKGLRPPSLFLAGGGSELEGLEDEDGREALNWEVRALGRPDLKV